MLRNLWKTLRSVVIAVGVLLSFFAVIEVLRAYQTLYNIHPAPAFIFLGVLACAVGGIVVYFTLCLMSHPPVLIPPELIDRNSATKRQLCRYGRYLTKYIDRLRGNDVLSAEDAKKAGEGRAKLCTAIGTADNDAKCLLMAIQVAEEQTIEPLLNVLDEKANKEIRTSVGVVMGGVALSPYKAADLIIVLYRNVLMVIRLIRIYNSRPRFQEQLRVLADTLGVVATVNYINLGKSLLEGLGSKVPVIGKCIDDIAQGIGAGFMTSVTGHAAMDRCRCFRAWNDEEAKNNLRNRAFYFYTDVKDMFKTDILPGVISRSKEPLDKIRSGVLAALDETGNVIGRFIKAPVNVAGAASSGVMKAGISGQRAIVGTATRIWSSATRKAKGAGLGALQTLGSAGSKVLSYPGKAASAIHKSIRRQKH